MLDNQLAKGLQRIITIEKCPRITRLHSASPKNSTIGILKLKAFLEPAAKVQNKLKPKKPKPKKKTTSNWKIYKFRGPHNRVQTIRKLLAGRNELRFGKYFQAIAICCGVGGIKNKAPFLGTIRNYGSSDDQEAISA